MATTNEMRVLTIGVTLDDMTQIRRGVGRLIDKYSEAWQEAQPRSALQRAYGNRLEELENLYRRLSDADPF